MADNIHHNTILDIQENFALMYGYERRINWDHTPKDAADSLKSKIQQLMPQSTTATTKAESRSIKEQSEAIFNAVWAQRKYTNHQLLSSVIYVCVTRETCVFSAVPDSCHFVFRTKRCFGNEDKGNSDCCKIFIDETGRVYQNWESYKSENKLPEGYMIAPKNGVYTFDERDRVELEVCPTPASRTSEQVLRVADKSTAVAGLGTAAICVAAATTTLVAAPVAVGAAFIGAGVGLYGALRSGASLFDRKAHEQTVSLKNTQARNAWLSVAAGAFAMGASGATKVMTTAVATGSEVPLTTQLLVNGMNISSIALSGASAGNSVLDLIMKYKDDDPITALDVIQLSASLILFTHSVQNFQLASNIITETRNGTFQAYRNALSKRQRKMFDKMSRETIRLRGPEKGKIELIRSLNEMPASKFQNQITFEPLPRLSGFAGANLNEERRPLIIPFPIENSNEFRLTLNSYIEIIGTEEALWYVMYVLTPLFKCAAKNELEAFVVPEETIFHVIFEKTLETLNDYSLMSLVANTNEILHVVRNIFRGVWSRYVRPFLFHRLIGMDDFIDVILEDDEPLRLQNFPRYMQSCIRSRHVLSNVFQCYYQEFDAPALAYIIGIANLFMESSLPQIQNTLVAITIPTENVLCSIFGCIKRNLKDRSLVNIIAHTEAILIDVGNHYRAWASLEPAKCIDTTDSNIFCQNIFKIYSDYIQEPSTVYYLETLMRHFLSCNKNHVMSSSHRFNPPNILHHIYFYTVSNLDDFSLLHLIKHTDKILHDLKINFLNMPVVYEAPVLPEEVAVDYNLVVHVKNYEKVWLTNFPAPILEHIGEQHAFSNILHIYGSTYDKHSLLYIIGITNIFIQTTLLQIHDVLDGISITAEKILYHIFQEIDKLSSTTPQFILTAYTKDILQNVEDYFMSWKTSDPHGRKVPCTKCNGYFVISSKEQ